MYYNITTDMLFKRMLTCVSMLSFHKMQYKFVKNVLACNDVDLFVTPGLTQKSKRENGMAVTKVAHQNSSLSHLVIRSIKVILTFVYCKAT